MSLRITIVGLIKFISEKRRMVSDFVMTELHIRGKVKTPRSIGMGSYNMDSHHVQRYVAKDENGKSYALNEGDIQVNPGGPYQISYDSIIPSHSECKNILIPVCLSSSCCLWFYQNGAGFYDFSSICCHRSRYFFGR